MTTTIKEIAGRRNIILVTDQTDQYLEEMLHSALTGHIQHLGTRHIKTSENSLYKLINESKSGFIIVDNRHERVATEIITMTRTNGAKFAVINKDESVIFYNCEGMGTTTTLEKVRSLVNTKELVGA